MIELAELDLPFLEPNEYRAVCSAVWYLREGYSLDNACKYACKSKGVPAAFIKRTIKAGLPANYFYKRQRKSVTGSQTVYKSHAVNMRHMASI
jgi:hypothetical protein